MPVHNLCVLAASNAVRHGRSVDQQEWRPFHRDHRVGAAENRRRNGLLHCVQVSCIFNYKQKHVHTICVYKYIKIYVCVYCPHAFRHRNDVDGLQRPSIVFTLSAFIYLDVILIIMCSFFCIYPPPVSNRVSTKSSISKFKKTQFSTMRRFSDFLGLHDILVAKYLRYGRIIPPAPSKNIIGIYPSVNIYIHRRKANCIFFFLNISCLSACYVMMCG